MESLVHLKWDESFIYTANKYYRNFLFAKCTSWHLWALVEQNKDLSFISASYTLLAETVTTAYDVSDCDEQYREHEARMGKVRALGGVLPCREWVLGCLIYMLTFKQRSKKQKVYSTQCSRYNNMHSDLQGKYALLYPRNSESHNYRVLS